MNDFQLTVKIKKKRKTFIPYLVPLSEPQVGDLVHVNNLDGELLCSSKMGVNSLDLFNHVITEENDLRSFLGTDNCDDTDKNASLAIKSYLKFCSITGSRISATFRLLE